MNKIKFLVLAALVFCLFGGNGLAVETMGVDINGFVSQGFIISDEYHYLTHDSKDGSFQYNELGINFSKDLKDNLRLGIQFFSRDLGDAANNKVTIDWAYGDYRVKDWLGIRAGRIKLPLGLYNETRDIDLLRTAVVMPQSVYCDMIRDSQIAANGAGLYGSIDLAGAGFMDYQVIGGQMNVYKESGIKKWFDARFSPAGITLGGDPDPGITWVGNLRWASPLDGLSLGVSGMKMEVDNPILVLGLVSAIQETDSTLLTYSTEYSWNDLLLAAEYLTFKSESNINGNRMEQTSLAYYLSASYRFTDLFSMGAYYSVLYQDKDDKDGDALFAIYNLPRSDAWEKDLALTFRFDIDEYITFKIEGHMVDGTARVNRNDNPVHTEDEFTYGVSKVTFSF
jgi:hypothetical protein